MEDKNMVEEKEILNIENLKVRFETEDGVVYAVNGVNLKLGYKKTLGLVGETGAGKTTTALAMLRLVPDPPGVVECDRLEIDGQDIRAMSITSLEEVRGKEISMIFQDPMTALNPVFTVGEQIAESIMIHEHLKKEEAMEKAPAEELFENPIHPYTQALLSAIPIPELGHKRERVKLVGEITSPIEPPEECRFAKRCLYCDKSICMSSVPKLIEVKPNHFVACPLKQKELGFEV